MLKKLIKLPVTAAAFVAAKAMGRGTGPAAEPPPPTAKKAPPRPAAPPPARPAAAPAEDHGHDHTHGHGHSHDHAPARKIDVRPEETPNPNARKFVCSVPVVEQGSLSFSSATEAMKHPVGKAIFAVGGVKSVFAVNDFVTVTKLDDADWGSLTPRLVKAISASLGG